MNKTQIKILLIEDNPADEVLLKVTLERDPRVEYQITTVERLSEGVQKSHESNFEIVLLNLGLPDNQGLDTLRQFHEKGADLPVIVLSDVMDEEAALQAV